MIVYHSFYGVFRSVFCTCFPTQLQQQHSGPTMMHNTAFVSCNGHSTRCAMRVQCDTQLVVVACNPFDQPLFTPHRLSTPTLGKRITSNTLPWLCTRLETRFPTKVSSNDLGGASAVAPSVIPPPSLTGRTHTSTRSSSSQCTTIISIFL